MKNNINESTKIYNVAIYARLSREDDSSLESNSIKNQVEFVSKYVIDKGWNIVDVYSDDGYTGSNFNRPAFKRMMSDIENKKINMVVTKDYSRLGRDQIETARHYQNIFPVKGIRYIAINDNLDTDNSSTYMTSSLISVFNDFYAKDISNKVNTAMNTKRYKGDFIGSFPPYGYEKCQENKNKLIIDKEVADIVSQIFKMYLDGKGFKGIATELNKKMIPCPVEYKKFKFPNYKNTKAKTSLWQAQTIKNILENPTYTGSVSQGKYIKPSHKEKLLKSVPKSNWIIVPNTHDAIIDEETFNRVQDIMKSRTNTASPAEICEHILSGLIYCGDCKERMTFSKSYSSKSYYAICSKYKRFGKLFCSRHSISENELIRLVIDDIKKLAKLAVDNEKLLIEAQKKGMSQKGENIELQLNKIESRLSMIKYSIKSLYTDKVKGVVTTEDYMNLSKDFNDERNNLIEQKNELLVKQEDVHRLDNEIDHIVNYVKQFTEFKEIDRRAVTRLIDKIEIFEDKRIVIHYHFKRPE